MTGFRLDDVLFVQVPGGLEGFFASTPAPPRPERHLVCQAAAARLAPGDKKLALAYVM